MQESVKTTLRLMLLAMVCALVGPALAQQFPAKEVQIIIPYAPGGTNLVIGGAFARRVN